MALGKYGPNPGDVLHYPRHHVVYNPWSLAKLCWPDTRFYDKQLEVMESVVWNKQTFVPAGNMLGKDFVTAFLVLWFFLTRHPVHIVTTSADYNQLESVLWGEMRRFIQTSVHPLTAEKGGPILMNHMHMRKMIAPVDPKSGRPLPNSKLTEMCGLSYCIPRVAAKGEGMLGHHIPDRGDGIPRTLFVCDEASGVEDINYDNADTWADRMLIIGNTYPCNNFWKKGVKGGDIPIAG